jgi:hypothetical protein
MLNWQHCPQCAVASPWGTQKQWPSANVQFWNWRRTNLFGKRGGYLRSCLQSVPSFTSCLPLHPGMRRSRQSSPTRPIQHSTQACADRGSLIRLGPIQQSARFCNEFFVFIFIALVKNLLQKENTWNINISKGMQEDKKLYIFTLPQFRVTIGTYCRGRTLCMNVSYVIGHERASSVFFQCNAPNLWVLIIHLEFIMRSDFVDEDLEGSLRLKTWE